MCVCIFACVFRFVYIYIHAYQYISIYIYIYICLHVLNLKAHGGKVAGGGRDCAVVRQPASGLRV